tara:strand:+ start:31 stop:255 length:225 start_codon:yes stop_codon:yes gene_type:complete
MRKNVFHNGKNYEELKIRKLDTPLKINPKKNVDINMLLNRVKTNKLSERKEKLIFSSLGFLILIVMGIFVTITS